jgi:transcriptional regulator with XRE-family HTH domain
MNDNPLITKIDQFVIDYVYRLRIENGLRQEDIANILNVKSSFIGNIENKNSRAKYNLKHINLLAEYFEISPKNFLPEKSH